MDDAGLARTGEPLAASASALESVRRLIMETARARVEALAAGHARAGASISAHVVDAAPVPGLVHRLEQRPHDLAVVGASGRRGIRRLGLGSVAEAVVRRAPCSVLVARGHAAAD